MLSDCIDDGELILLSLGPAYEAARIHRDRRKQALLPLTDEVLKAATDPLFECLDNEEFKSLFATLGCGIYCEELSVNNPWVPLAMRYERVILAMSQQLENDQLIRIFERFFKPVLETGALFTVPPTSGLSEAEFIARVLAPESRTISSVSG